MAARVISDARNYYSDALTKMHDEQTAYLDVHAPPAAFIERLPSVCVLVAHAHALRATRAKVHSAVDMHSAKVV